RAAARHPGQEQAAVRIGDREPPLRAPLLTGHEIPGDAGQHGPEPGDLPGPFVEPEQGGQPDPDLDPGSRSLARAPDAGSRPALVGAVRPAVACSVVGDVVAGAVAV